MAYWLEKVAEQGDITAQNQLVLLYRDGVGVTKSNEKMAYWLEKVAEQGDAFAQCELGRLYYDGKGVAQDYGKAVYWFAKSEERGHTNVQHNLGKVFLEVNKKTEIRNATERQKCKTSKLTSAYYTIFKWLREVFADIKKQCANLKKATGQ